MHERTTLGPLVAALLMLTSSAGAQLCPHRGSAWQRATTMAGPWMHCTWGPWPAWHLYVPAHRRPTARPQKTLGDARPLARRLIRYGCADYLAAPIGPPRIAIAGWVYDVPERPCGPS